MTIVAICRSCGAELSTPQEVWNHRPKCFFPNPVIDMYRRRDQQDMNGIEREEMGRVLVMEAK